MNFSNTQHTHKLSKSTFIRGLQCEKSLYLYKYHYDLMDEVSESQQAIFDRGTDIGVLAQGLFPNGVDCKPPSHLQYQICINNTKEALANGAKIIYEAGFIYDEVMVICDILVKEKGSWHIYEVKSSTSISEVYLDDASVQFYVVKNSLPSLKKISIVYINNQYVRKGVIDIKKLFAIEDVTEFTAEKEYFVIDNIDRLKGILKKRVEPKIDIGPHCNDPYPCPFLGHCWKNIPDYSVFDIANLKSDKKFELYRNGIIKIKDVPNDYPLSSSQRIQVECEISKKTIIDKPAIKDFLSKIKYPVAFMDFETIMPAVPLFDCSRPYQQIPFQYSIHIQFKKNSPLIHKEYLAEADLKIDPRIGFIENLVKDLTGAETIIVYNQSFEITRLTETARDFPEYDQAIQKFIPRILDLMKPFQIKSYYSPEMKGSYSIKKVLPALVPELNYNDLEISEGGIVSREFERLYYEIDQERISRVRKSLLVYCKMDTIAMCKILDKLSDIEKSLI
ncbi:MAG: DUF2779 domain-containing protein [Melioribacteraceae bacterium]|nr:DUF2779 domain-containing protein [Melioribacteraceae bacterium]